MGTAMMFLERRMRKQVRASLAGQPVRIASRAQSTHRSESVIVLDLYSLNRQKGYELLGFRKAVLIASNTLGIRFFETTYNGLKDRGIDLLGVVDPERESWGRLLGYLVGNKNENGI